MSKKSSKNNSNKIVIYDTLSEEANLSTFIKNISNLEILDCKNELELFAVLDKKKIACILLTFSKQSAGLFDLLNGIRTKYPRIEVIVLSYDNNIEKAVTSLKLGAFDYLDINSVKPEKLESTLANAIERFNLNDKLYSIEHYQSPKKIFYNIIGTSQEMQDIYQIIESIAQANSSILIQGESGTGKELVAEAIHKTSKRCDGPFVVIHCAAISENLLESELFGHLKGSFTGAISDKIGLFQEADQGTVFLDEIGEISPSIQVKLLRVLQNGEIKPVGASQSKRVDVRVISATNKDLLSMTQEGNFREDLYYRLNVIGLNMPPLREREEDIPDLALHFLDKYTKDLNKNIDGFSIDAMQALKSYQWVGNVRELENTIERCVVLCAQEQIRAKDLPSKILSSTFYMLEGDEEDFTEFTYQEAKSRALHAFNKSYISSLLQQSNGNISQASNKAGMDRSNFKKIVKKYEIDISEFTKLA